MFECSYLLVNRLLLFVLFNPFNVKVSLKILLAVCQTIRMLLLLIIFILITRLSVLHCTDIVMRNSASVTYRSLRLVN